MAARREGARTFKDGQHALIPVLLRESVLDSVTFRATTKHFEDQIDAVDSWLTAFIRHARDFATQFSKLEDLAVNLHGRAVPTFIESGIVDPDFTVAAMARCSDANRAYWQSIFAQVKNTEQTLTEPLVRLQNNELKEIRHLSNEFHRQQKAYDEMLRHYLQQPKTKEASSLREDAFQLYEKRKAYIKASFDYTIKMSTFRSALDSSMIAAFSSTFQSTADHTSAIATDFASRPSMRQISVWSEEMRKSSRVAEEHLYSLRLNMEDEANKLVSPPRDLNEYTSSPAKRVSKPTTSMVQNRPAKQGWLMMRGVTGKPARYVWHRRWCFVKYGVFSWLSNNPKTGAVEEADRYGVLLCNVKLPLLEDRRFCIEVLTKDSIILLQAETDAEAAEWLNVFELSKKAVIESQESDTHAFAVTKPPSEFAAPFMALEAGHGEHVSEILNATPKKGHTKQDSGGHGISALISASTIAGNLVTPRTGGLFGRIEDQKHYNPFETSTESNALSPITFAPAPVNTHLTKESLLDSTTSIVHVPSGSQANHWGSINYGMLNSTIQNAFEAKGSAKFLASPEAAIDSIYLTRDRELQDKGIWNITKQYPAEYPPDLRRQDAQFGCIFPHARSEHVLMVIRGTRNFPPYKGSFSGRAYITLRGFYFYSQAYGLILVQSCLFSEILSVRVNRLVDYTELVLDIHDVGEAKMILYLDDADLVRKRIELLLGNYIADEPQGTYKMLSLLQSTLPDHTKVIRSNSVNPRVLDESSGDERENDTKRPSKLDAVRLKLPSEPVISEPDNQGLRKLYDAEYMVTAKALFHLLYGNRSPLWLTFYRNLLNFPSVQQMPWQTLEDGSLARAFRYDTGLEGTDATFAKQDNQRIGKRIEHVDYVVTTYVRPWHLPHGDDCFMLIKSNVTFVSKTKSRLRIWVDVDWRGHKYLTRGVITKALLETSIIAASDLTHLIESEVLDRLGLAAKTSKAVRIYGRVGGHSDPMTLQNSENEILPQLKQYTDWDLIKRYPMVFIISVLADVWTILMSATQYSRSIISANGTILCLLALSVISNAYLGGLSSTTYWQHRSAIRLLDNIETSPVGLMSRHVTLHEIETIAYNQTSPASLQQQQGVFPGLCFSAFQADSASHKARSAYHSAFRTTRNKISKSRNNLLVAMKVLNGIETEIVKGEWTLFVQSEQLHCAELDHLNLSTNGLTNGLTLTDAVKDHCLDCARYV